MGQLFVVQSLTYFLIDNKIAQMQCDVSVIEQKHNLLCTEVCEALEFGICSVAEILICLENIRKK